MKNCDAGVKVNDAFSGGKHGRGKEGAERNMMGAETRKNKTQVRVFHTCAW